MNIDYTINNVSCNGGDDGSISIDTITLTSGEYNIYGFNYTIDWTDNIDNEQLLNSNLIATSLSADTYGFRLFGNSTYSSWTYVNVTEPLPLTINSIIKNNNPCNTNATITVNISGGTPPYTTTYDIYSIVGSGTEVVFSGLNIDLSSLISVTDTEGCSVTSDSTTDIVFSNTTIDFLSQSPPLIYDDHLESFTFSITGYGPFKILIWNTDDNGNKNTVVDTIEFFDTSYLTSINNNIFTYDIGSIIYPGSYIFDIIDSNNCSITTSVLNAQNSNPLSVNLTSTNNNPIDNGFFINTSTIFDTLLIPINLIINNNNLLNFIKQLNLNDKILIKINDVEYLQKVILFNKNKSNIDNNYLDILQLAPSLDWWFFSIPIAIGFDYTTLTNIFTDNIRLVYNNEEYTIIPELDNESSTIKLIRGALISTAFNTSQFSKNNKVGVYSLSGSEYTLIQEIESTYNTSLYNTYVAGLVYHINFMDNNIINSNIDIFNPQIDAPSLDKLSYQQKVKNALAFINNTNNTTYIAASQNYQNNGGITFNITGGYIDNNYSIEYKYWNEESNNLQNIYLNNNPLTQTRAYGLKEGVYIVKITDKYNNKIKILNNISYDNHYSEALNYIYNIFNTTPSNLNFQYGDLLIPVYRLGSSSTTLQNSIIGTDPPIIPPVPDPIILTEEIIQVNVTNNSIYNNSLIVTINPTNISAHISGPNGYNKIFSNKTQFNNLPPGVYYISGNDNELRNNYLFNKLTKVYVSNNLQDNINIIFDSYLNQYIVGN
jgi:hypothetical protein